MRRSQKEQVVAWLRDQTASDETVIFAGFHGLTVAAADELRAKMREQGAVYKVAKNTLLRIAFDGKADAEALEALLTGTTAVAIARDPVAVAKVIKDFTKDNDAITIKGALLGGQVLSAEDAVKLADLPSKDQLLGQLAAMLMQPLTQLAGALSAPMRDLANVLNQVKEAKEG